MSHWVCVPVKPFIYGKSRLAGMISDDERYQLNRALLSHTLQIISRSMWHKYVLVISKGEEALDMAKAFGFNAVIEHPPFGLNRSLQTVSKNLDEEKAESITVVPADLVLLTIEELDEIYTLRMKLPGIIIVPDRFKAGTNILSVNPVGAIPFRYGRNSFTKHCQSAKNIKLPIKIIESRYLGFDLDTEQDLNELEQLCPEICQSIPEICCFQKIFP